jgi:HNH endonuclease
MHFFAIFATLFFISLLERKKISHKIPLHNKKGEITGYAIVSLRDYECLNKFSWYLDRDGYARSTIEGKRWGMNRYIMIVLMSNKINPNDHVDHINGTRLDNRRSNLRCLTAQNDRNMRKQVRKGGTTSKHIGVSCVKAIDMWVVSIKIGRRKIRAYYENEDHAGYQYNLWIDQYNLTTAKRNNVQEPEDFVPWKSRRQEKNLPKYISIDRSGSYRVRICEKQYGSHSYKTLEEAIMKKDEQLKKIKEEEEKKLRSTPILRNAKGVPVIELFDQNGKKVAETEVDEDRYYDLKHYGWHLDDGYVRGNVDEKPVRLSRYVMNYYGEYLIDHINNDPLDNRVSNLRIATPRQNAMNTKISGFTGVYERKNGKHSARIVVKGRCINLGTFETKADAIKARIEATKKYFGEQI